MSQIALQRTVPEIRESKKNDTYLCKRNLQISKNCCVIHWILLVIVFVMSLASLILCGVLLLPQTKTVSGVTLADIQVLMDTVATINRELSQINTTNSIYYGEDLQQKLMTSNIMLAKLNETISQIQSQIVDIDHNVSFYHNVFSNLSFDNTFRCVEEERECIMNHEEASTNTPSFATCETPRLPHTQPDLTNVNIYCSVDNAVGETNPLLATLHIYNAEISCVCSIVAISAASNSPTCKLNVRRCPNTIRLN